MSAMQFLLIVTTLFTAGSAFALSEMPSEGALIRTFSSQKLPVEDGNIIDPLTCNGWDLEDGMISRCVPDSLFTWTSLEKSKRVIELLENRQSWAFQWGNVFFAKSPISTFAYGEVSIRVKLKPGLQFLPVTYGRIPGVKSTYDTCRGSVEEMQKTVYFASLSYSDFVICSPEVIESISVHTKNHYDEMIRDYIQHKSNPKRADFYGFFPWARFELFGEWLDNHEMLEAKLIENFRLALKLIGEGQSRILADPNMSVDLQTEQAHFSTKQLMYFHKR